MKKIEGNEGGFLIAKEDIPELHRQAKPIVDYLINLFRLMSAIKKDNQSID